MDIGDAIRHYSRDNSAATAFLCRTEIWTQTEHQAKTGIWPKRLTRTPAVLANTVQLDINRTIDRQERGEG